MLRIRRGESAAADGSAGALRRALAALCVTEIVSYGVIYYAVPVLAVQIAAGTGWSRTAVTAAYSALVNLVPLLTGRGMSPGLAAWALGLGGAGQVAGRLCYRALDARTGPRGRAAAVIAAGSAVTLLLGLLPGPAALLVTAAVIAGAVRGVFTLTEATLVADQWGADRYAVINSGVFNAPLTAASTRSRSPSARASPPSTGSYTRPCSAILAAVAATGAVLVGTAPAPSRSA